jgi:Uma2 family endonuclease
VKLELDLPDTLPLTADDFERLPHVEGVRLELWEGNLVMAAAAQRAWHSEMAFRITTLLRRQGLRTAMEVGVVVGSRGVPAPDVTVFRSGVDVDLDRSQFPAADVLRVVEIVSPDSMDRDRVDKPVTYARAGIPEYWIVEQAVGSFDAVVHEYALSPTASGDAYILIRTVTLTELESADGTHS